MMIDTLICARWVIPVDPADSVMEQHAIAIHQGRILDILPTDLALARYQANETVHLRQHALTPGFINAHTHAAMTLLRGIADDLPLMTWLEKHIWPLEQHWLSAEWVRDGARLAIAEMLRSGTTCFNDMYFFPEVTVREALHAGMRAVTGMIVMDFASAWASDVDSYLRQGLALREQYHHDPLVHMVFAPHAPYTTSDATLLRIRTLSDELETPIHMHVHETAQEVQQSLEHYGMRPLARLDQLGLLDQRLITVHMTQLQIAEIELLAQRNVKVIHCPESNMKLASGICPVAALQQAGVCVALGTDGAASNNDLDMFGEMRSAALLGKIAVNNASAVNAHQTLRMATIEGARALGLEQQTGSLCKGKWADIIAVNLETLETTPVYDVVSTLVYACDRRQVSDVWVAGKALMKKRKLTNIDEDEVINRTRFWQNRLRNTRFPVT